MKFEKGFFSLRLTALPWHILAYIVEQLGNDRALLMRLVSKDVMHAIGAVYHRVRPRMIGPSKWDWRARAIRSNPSTHRMFTNHGAGGDSVGRARGLITSPCISQPVMYEITCEGGSAHDIPALMASFGRHDKVDLCISSTFWMACGSKPNLLPDLVALKSRISRFDVHDCAMDQLQFDALLRMLPKTIEYIRLEDIAVLKKKNYQSLHNSALIAKTIDGMVGLVYLDLCFTLGCDGPNKRGKRAFHMIAPALSTLSELQWLNLSGTTIHPGDLTHVLASTLKLRILIIARCLRTFTPALARALLSSPMLERLSMAQCYVRLDMLNDAAGHTDSRLAQIDLFGTYAFRCDDAYSTLACLLAKLRLRRLILLYTLPNTQELVRAVGCLSLAEPIEFILSVPRHGALSSAESRAALTVSACTKLTWVDDGALPPLP